MSGYRKVVKCIGLFSSSRAMDPLLLVGPGLLINLPKNYAAFYKIPPENVVVLHDEISFDAGVIRIRRKGSAGGHNGLKSIISHLNSDAFPRIKIGVGQKPTPESDLVSWVLGRIPESDLEKIREKFEPIFDSVSLIASGKIDDAMCKYSR